MLNLSWPASCRLAVTKFFKTLLSFGQPMAGIRVAPDDEIATVLAPDSVQPELGLPILGGD